VLEPTREQALLDLVICNDADVIRELNVKEPLAGSDHSDHNKIEFTLQFEREMLDSNIMVLQLSKGNHKAMREELARLDWKGSLAGKNVEQQWQEWRGGCRLEIYSEWQIP